MCKRVDTASPTESDEAAFYSPAMAVAAVGRKNKNFTDFFCFPTSIVSPAPLTLPSFHIAHGAICFVVIDTMASTLRELVGLGLAPASELATCAQEMETLLFAIRNTSADELEDVGADCSDLLKQV